MQTSGPFLERTALETLSWFSHFKWARVLEKLAERETAVSSGGRGRTRCTQASGITGFLFCCEALPRNQRGTKGRPQPGGLAEICVVLGSFAFSPGSQRPLLHSVLCALIIPPSAAVMLLLIFLLIF